MHIYNVKNKYKYLLKYLKVKSNLDIWNVWEYKISIYKHWNSAK